MSKEPEPNRHHGSLPIWLIMGVFAFCGAAVLVILLGTHEITHVNLVLNLFTLAGVVIAALRIYGGIIENTHITRKSAESTRAKVDSTLKETAQLAQKKAEEEAKKAEVRAIAVAKGITDSLHGPLEEIKHNINGGLEARIKAVVLEAMNEHNTIKSVQELTEIVKANTLKIKEINEHLARLNRQ